MQFIKSALGLAFITISPALLAAEFETKPADPVFKNFSPLKAPVYSNSWLRAGDQLAIIGDSITEQKQYSRIIETYLTVCAPELKVSVRQFGWGGETAEGFLRRMTNDCLRFQPTVATLCFGMNDHGYDAYVEAKGQWYVTNYTGIVRALKAHGARVVVGSPGCVGRVPRWAWRKEATLEELNLNLGQLRNHDIAIAAQEQQRFADVFWPMLVAGYEGQKRFGADFAIAGKDGVHPDWAGHLIMARAFLKSFGLDGHIGTFTVDLGQQTATASNGHQVHSFTGNKLTVTSSRYPFCATGEPDKDNSIRAAMNLVPFNDELNRLLLVVKNGTAPNYAITWGKITRRYPASQLAAGVNLAADFAENPFSEAFGRVDRAVFTKQNYETVQIKDLFYTPAAKAAPDRIATLSDQVREPLAAAIAGAFVPVTHTIQIQPQ